MSWWKKHQKELLGGLGLLGLGATGFGLAGAGPLAGLLGGAGTAAKAGMAGATLAPELAGPTTAGAKGLMGLGSVLGGATPQVSGSNALLASQGAGLLTSGQQPPQPPAPPPPPAQPMPQSNFAGYGDGPPPGIDPMTWAQLPEELKRQLRAQRGQA